MIGTNPQANPYNRYRQMRGDRMINLHWEHVITGLPWWGNITHVFLFCKMKVKCQQVATKLPVSYWPTRCSNRYQGHSFHGSRIQFLPSAIILCWFCSFPWWRWWKDTIGGFKDSLPRSGLYTSKLKIITTSYLFVSVTHVRAYFLSP